MRKFNVFLDTKIIVQGFVTFFENLSEDLLNQFKDTEFIIQLIQFIITIEILTTHIWSHNTKHYLIVERHFPIM